ncbi:MAG: hypothetical protein AB7J40_03215 [Candidatus Altimarinota bacterium]
MALTKKDLHKISLLFNQACEHYLFPRFDRIESRLDGVESRLDGVESRLEKAEKVVKSIKNDLHEYVQNADDKFKEANQNIGYYFQKCATRSEQEALEKRVKKLELSRS